VWGESSTPGSNPGLSAILKGLGQFGATWIDPFYWSFSQNRYNALEKLKWQDNLPMNPKIRIWIFRQLEEVIFWTRVLQSPSAKGTICYGIRINLEI
jgi:hypothetical protein